MKVSSLLLRLFSTDGRVPRSRFAATIFIAGAALAGLTELPWEAGVIAWIALGGVIGLLAAKSLAEMAARLHDMGHSSRFGALVGASLGVLAAVAATVALAGGPGWPLTAVLLLLLAVLVALLLVPGQQSANLYGSQPTYWARPRGSTGRAGLVLAGALLVIGAGMGGWLASVAAGLRAENNATLHVSETRRAIEVNETDPFLR